MSSYISQRRNHIDNFFFSNAKIFNGKILDLGGKKINKRGNTNKTKREKTKRKKKKERARNE